jgi:sigma-E factor negative regulatory protein RseB
VSYRVVAGWRIVSLAAIVGLLGSGVAALALADAPGVPSIIKRPSLGSRLARPPRAGRPVLASATVARPVQVARANLGLQLLQEAAAASQGTSYRGEQIVLWWGPGETSASVVEVWHQPGGMTLVQASGATAGTVGGIARTPAADNQDPDGILGVTDRLLDLLQSNYEVVYAGRGSAAGRAALVVEVRRPTGALAARFWLDAATKLPLRREIYVGGARMISEDAFITLEIGGRGLGGLPAPAAAPWTAQLDEARLAALRASGWPVPGQLPGNLVLFAATETSQRSGQVIDLSYSDGLAVVSLFVQRGDLAAAMPGWRQITVRGRTVYSVDPDDRSFAWSANGFVYTVIADAPAATVSQVVTALPGSTKLGFWARMGRGFHRLASWLNPLR